MLAGSCVAGLLLCGFVRSNRSLIDSGRRGLSLHPEALAFLLGVSAFFCLLGVAVMSFGLPNERICGLSIREVARRHHGRSAPLWPRVIESIAFRLFTESLGSVSLPTAVWRSMHSLSDPLCSLDLTPALWIC